LNRSAERPNVGLLPWRHSRFTAGFIVGLLNPALAVPRPDRRARAQRRFPIELRQHLLDAIYAGQSFITVVRDLGLTSGVGLAKTDQAWSSAYEATLTAARCDDLEHGTNAAPCRVVLPGVSVPSESGSGPFALI
jgi:hypothetical protein